MYTRACLYRHASLCMSASARAMHSSAIYVAIKPVLYAYTSEIVAQGALTVPRVMVKTLFGGREIGIFRVFRVFRIDESANKRGSWLCSNLKTFGSFINFSKSEKIVLAVESSLHATGSYLYEKLFRLILAYIVGWEQERPISARCVRTSYLGSARKNVSSLLLCRSCIILETITMCGHFAHGV